jgi:hypothetical protein
VGKNDVTFGIHAIPLTISVSVRDRRKKRGFVSFAKNQKKNYFSKSFEMYKTRVLYISNGKKKKKKKKKMKRANTHFFARIPHSNTTRLLDSRTNKCDTDVSMVGFSSI